MSARGWALASPGGRLIAETFDRAKGVVESCAYDYLRLRYDWARAPGYWKQVAAFREARERRGWCILRVRLVEEA